MRHVHAFGDDALGHLDAVGLIDALNDGAVSRAEVVEAAIARTEAVNPTLNGLAYQAFDRARAQAAKAPVRPDNGFFSGVPTFIKDNVDVAGLPTMRGTDAWPPRPAAVDGDFTRVYLATGTIPLNIPDSERCAIRGTPTTPPAHRRRGPGRLSPPAPCRSRMPTTAAARSEFPRLATDSSG